MEPVVDSWLSGTDGFGAGVGSGFGSGVGSFGISTVTLQIAVLFPSEELEQLTTVESVVDYLKQKGVEA